jgi:pimeloyl-ACP methyl ester carboxylesterase
MTAVREFAINTPETELRDLSRRLRATRWPEQETVDDWSQGMPLAYLRELCTYWAQTYDWRAREAIMNGFPQFMTEIDGLDIHFIHARSPEPDAVPLLMTHGWPGSVVEFFKVVGPLTDPARHGGRREDAVHLVCPSLPGYAFSSRPAARGFGVEKIAGAWDRLMSVLGYKRYLAQGGDWGAAVTTEIAVQNRGSCAAIHITFPLVAPTAAAKSDPDETDRRAFAATALYRAWETGYSTQQKTRPQTVGYGLVDSPAALAAWIIEKFQAWTDCDGHPENVLTRDELLDNVMLYWLPATGASSARLYWESFDRAFANRGRKVELPVGCSIFPKELIPIPRSWAAARYTNILYWNELDRGGHFAAFEQPEAFTAELRAWLRCVVPTLSF